MKVDRFALPTISKHERLLIEFKLKRMYLTKTFLWKTFEAHSESLEEGISHFEYYLRSHK